MTTKSLNTLPRAPQEKKQLLKKLANAIVNLENQIHENNEDIRFVIKNQQYIQTLKLRQRLIAKCGELSLMRLSHLEEIFKHYCTHVFKTGKHMTFDKLQYARVHMTIERFFLFLKDFELTVANIDAKNREVLEKQSIILTFKKVSSNARELSFEEFIQVIEKLAIFYWDGKQNYHQKKKQYELRMKKIKKENQKRKKKRMRLQGSSSQNQKSGEEAGKSQNQENEEGQEHQEQKSMEKSNVKNDPPAPPQNQNDDLINELMNNEDIEDPNEEVRKVAQKAKKQNQVVQSIRKMQKQDFQSMLQLTNEQKIEFYYQILDIDSIDSYKKKLTQLNLANYIVHRKKNEDNNVKALSESKLEAAMQHEEERLQKLKAKMNEKKEKLKERPLPKPSNEQARKEEENSRRRKQMKKERQKAVKEFKVDEVKKTEEKLKKATPKVQYKQGEVTLQMLEKLTLDHLKLKNFNPSKYYTIDEEDKYYLDDYAGSRPKWTQRMQNRERQSLSIVQSTKMRAKQLQNQQKNTHVRQRSSLARNRN